MGSSIIKMNIKKNGTLYFRMELLSEWNLIRNDRKHCSYRVTHQLVYVHRIYLTRKKAHTHEWTEHDMNDKENFAIPNYAPFILWKEWWEKIRSNCTFATSSVVDGAFFVVIHAF